MEDRAEQKIYLLLETHPQTWEAIKAAIKRVAVDDGSWAFFQRYHKPDPPLTRASDQSEESEDERE